MDDLEFIESTDNQWIDTGCAPRGEYVESKRQIDPSAFARAHNATVDENNMITMEVLCDGTAIFLMEMLWVLTAIGCTDVKYDSKVVTEGISGDKPWCSYLYTARGVLPDGIIYHDGVLCRREDGDSTTKGE